MKLFSNLQTYFRLSIVLKLRKIIKNFGAMLLLASCQKLQNLIHDRQEIGALLKQNERKLLVKMESGQNTVNIM